MSQTSLIDKKRIEKLNILKEAPNYSANDIKLLRKKYHLSQAVLAAVINTSISTVQKWEIGRKNPSGPSLKLLNILETKGLAVFIQ